MSQRIRVLIADDQRVVREGLAMVLGLLPEVEVVGSAADGDEAVALAADLLPDIVLMDLRMPRCDGVQATRLLRDRVPGATVVVLTTYADDRSVIDALRAGARGYLTKDAGGADIRQAIRQVLDNRAVIDPAVQHHVVDAIAALSAAQPHRPSAALPAGLTAREAEVLSLIAAGMSNREIADRLVVSEGTVKSHINHLLPKIGARDRAQAVTYAYQHGLAPRLTRRKSDEQRQPQEAAGRRGGGGRGGGRRRRRHAGGVVDGYRPSRAAKPASTMKDMPGMTGASGGAPVSYPFETLDNQNDVTFNQLLGINNENTIAGYFASGAAGHPNMGYLLLRSATRTAWAPPRSTASTTPATWSASTPTALATPTGSWPRPCVP